MQHEIFSTSFDCRPISKTNIATIFSLIQNSFFRVPLFGKLVDDYSSDDVGEENLKKAPVQNIRDESTIVILLPITIHILPDNFLCV